jgi:hypothetical protein
MAALSSFSLQDPLNSMIPPRCSQCLDIKFNTEREREYFRDIFGNELVYAKPVWNLLQRQFNVSSRR